ncbi:hypothetical protein TWF281_007522 [Arthrobotrys megalospora]
MSSSTAFFCNGREDESSSNWINLSPDPSLFNFPSSPPETEAQKINRLNRIQSHITPVQLTEKLNPRLDDYEKSRLAFLEIVTSGGQIDEKHPGNPDNIDPSVLVALQYPIPYEIMANGNLMDLFHPQYSNPGIFHPPQGQFKHLPPEVQAYSRRMFFLHAKLRNEIPEYHGAVEAINQYAPILRDLFFGQNWLSAELSKTFQDVGDKLKKFFVSLPARKMLRRVMEEGGYGYPGQRDTMTNSVSAMYNFLERYVSCMNLTKIIGLELEKGLIAKQAIEKAFEAIKFQVDNRKKVPDYIHLANSAETRHLEKMYSAASRLCPLELEAAWYTQAYVNIVEDFGKRKVEAIVNAFNELFKDCWTSEDHPERPQKLRSMVPGGKLWHLDFRDVHESIQKLGYALKIDPESCPVRKKKGSSSPKSTPTKTKQETTSPESSTRKKRKVSDDLESTPTKKRKETAAPKTKRTPKTKKAREGQEPPKVEPGLHGIDENPGDETTQNQSGPSGPGTGEADTINMDEIKEYTAGQA